MSASVAETLAPAVEALVAPAAEVRGLSKAFGRTQALRDVSVRVYGGEVHCLLGENGAGKSTLGKILGGLYAADQGDILVGGESRHFANVSEARAAGIALVFQELSLAPHLSVEDNLCLGSEKGAGPFQLLRRRHERERCRALLAECGIAVPLRARLGELPTAQQQLVEIAKALLAGPRLVVMDEPTAMLGAAEKEIFLKLLQRLRASGVAVIFITHHIEEVLEAADRVTIMRDGAVAHEFTMQPSIDQDYVVEKLAGRRLSGPRGAARVAAGAVIARLTKLPSVHDGEKEVELRRGEIVGLYGVVGCGREEMARSFVGLATAGEVILFDRRFSPRSPAGAGRAGVSYLPAGRAANCILPSRSIQENLMLTQYRQHQRGGLVRGRSETASAAGQLAELRVKYAAASDPITSLSGGNQQKVMLGRALGRAEHLLVLEEPTAGIDVAAKEEIHALLRRKADEGLAILLLSSDVMETIGLCHRIYSVFKGRLVETYEEPTSDDQSSILADVLGRFGNRQQTGIAG